jgi:hypothetical protein
MMKVNGNIKVDGTLYQAGAVYTAGAITRAYYSNTATGDQANTGLSGTDVDITGLTGKSFPGTPEVGNTYLVTANVGFDPEQQNALIKLWVGTNGSSSDTTPLFQQESRYRDFGALRVTNALSFIVTLANADHKIGVSLNLSAGAGSSSGISGGTAVATAYCFMEVMKLS